MRLDREMTLLVKDSLRAVDAVALEPWPQPEPIGDGLPPVAEFDEALLPESMRLLALDVADRMQIQPDFTAVILVAALSGAVGRRAVVQPKAEDNKWTEAGNLWALIASPPGSMKTSAIEAATRPMNTIQSEWRADFENEIGMYQQAQEESELKRSAWREQFKSASKKGGTPPERPEESLRSPKLKRLVVHDSTFEALHATMADNPAGLLAIRDEMSGLLAQLDREGREGERAFLLQAWNGQSSFTLDRIGRGTVHVEHCCLSLLGGIQPGRLRSYLADALSDGPTNDGLMQRFQLMVWPDIQKDWRYVDRPPDANAEKAIDRIFRAIVSLDPARNTRFRFDADAQSLFIAWLSELELRLRTEPMHPAMIAHLSKYRGLMPTLAMIFELADLADRGFVGFDGSGFGENQIIRLGSAQRAAAWTVYLESHARRVYSCISSSHFRGARELADKIRQKRIGEKGDFSTREVYLKGWSGVDSPDSARMALEVLVDAGWVRESNVGTNLSGGRPSQRWLVNPRVWQ